MHEFLYLARKSIDQICDCIVWPIDGLLDELRPNALLESASVLNPTRHFAPWAFETCVVTLATTSRLSRRGQLSGAASAKAFSRAARSVTSTRWG
jgi:hypothetical protein